MAKLYDELKCYICEKVLSEDQELYETAWSGVYWCGSNECAGEILTDLCEELDFTDPDNWEDE